MSESLGLFFVRVSGDPLRRDFFPHFSIGWI